jgi:hypothetical protein
VGADASAIALLTDDRDHAARDRADGRELGAYDAGAVDPDPYATAEAGKLEFSPDAGELAIERPDGAIVRVSREGRALGEIGAGSLRGYDHSGRYVLMLDREGRARIVDTRGRGARDLGPAADASGCRQGPRTIKSVASTARVIGAGPQRSVLLPIASRPSRSPPGTLRQPERDVLRSERAAADEAAICERRACVEGRPTRRRRSRPPTAINTTPIGALPKPVSTSARAASAVRR